MKSWSEIQNSEKFKALPTADKQRLAKSYRLATGSYDQYTEAPANQGQQQVEDPSLADQILAGVDDTQANASTVMADTVETLGMDNATAYFRKLADKNAQEAAQVAAPSLADVDGPMDLLFNYAPSVLARSSTGIAGSIALGAVNPAAGLGFAMTNMAGGMRREQMDRGIEGERTMAYGLAAPAAALSQFGLKAGGFLPSFAGRAAGQTAGRTAAQTAGQAATGVGSEAAEVATRQGFLATVNNVKNAAVRGTVAEAPTEGVQAVLEGIGGGDRDLGSLAWRGFEGTVGGGLAGGYMGAGKGVFNERNNIYHGMGEAGAKLGEMFDGLGSTGIVVDGRARGQARTWQDSFTNTANYLRDNNIQKGSPEYQAAIQTLMKDVGGLKVAATGNVLDMLQQEGITVNRDMLGSDYDGIVSFNEGLVYKGAKGIQSILAPDQEVADNKTMVDKLDNMFKGFKHKISSALVNTDEEIEAATRHRLDWEDKLRVAVADNDIQEAKGWIEHYSDIETQLGKDRVLINGVFNGMQNDSPNLSESIMRKLVAYDALAGTNIATQAQQAAVVKSLYSNAQSALKGRESSKVGKLLVQGAVAGATSGQSLLYSAIGGRAATMARRRMEKRALRRMDTSDLNEGGVVSPDMQSELDTSYSIAGREAEGAQNVADRVVTRAERKERGNLTDEQYDAKQKNEVSKRVGAITKGTNDLEAVLDGFTDIDPDIRRKADLAEIHLEDMEKAHLDGDADLFHHIKGQFDGVMIGLRAERKAFNREQSAKKSETKTKDTETRRAEMDARAKLQHKRNITSAQKTLRGEMVGLKLPKDVKETLGRRIHDLSKAESGKDLTNLKEQVKKEIQRAGQAKNEKQTKDRADQAAKDKQNKENAKAAEKKQNEKEKEQKARDKEDKAAEDLNLKIKYEQQQLSLELEKSGIKNEQDIQDITDEIGRMGGARSSEAVRYHAKLIRTLLADAKDRAKATKEDVDVDVDTDVDTDADVDVDVDTDVEAPLTTETPLDPNRPAPVVEPAANVNPMAEAPPTPVQPEVAVEPVVEAETDVTVEGGIEATKAELTTELEATLEALGDSVNPKLIDDIKSDIELLDVVEDVEAAVEGIKADIARLKEGLTTNAPLPTQAPAVPTEAAPVAPSGVTAADLVGRDQVNPTPVATEAEVIQDQQAADTQPVVDQDKAAADAENEAKKRRKNTNARANRTTRSVETPDGFTAKKADLPEEQQAKWNDFIPPYKAVGDMITKELEANADAEAVAKFSSKLQTAIKPHKGFNNAEGFNNKLKNLKTAIAKEIIKSKKRMPKADKDKFIEAYANADTATNRKATLVEYGLNVPTKKSR